MHGLLHDIWPASLLLAEYLAAQPSTAAGCLGLEQGFGAGLCGLVAAALGAEHTALTDHSPSVCVRALAAVGAPYHRRARAAGTTRDCRALGLGHAAAQRICKRLGRSHSCGALGLGTARPLRACWFDFLMDPGQQTCCMPACSPQYAPLCSAVAELLRLLPQ